jgi:hypothetical protein
MLPQLRGDLLPLFRHSVQGLALESPCQLTSPKPNQLALFHTSRKRGIRSGTQVKF